MAWWRSGPSRAQRPEEVYWLEAGGLGKLCSILLGEGSGESAGDGGEDPWAAAGAQLRGDVRVCVDPSAPGVVNFPGSWT